jgi:hypothetical protein
MYRLPVSSESLGNVTYEIVATPHDPSRRIQFRFAPAVARPASMKAFMFWIATLLFDHLFE